MLAIGNKAKFYIISKTELEIPKYIRLGKFMSKAKIKTRKVKFGVFNGLKRIEMYLNPNDIDQNRVKSFDLLNIHPTPLIKNSEITGKFYEIYNLDVFLPTDMRFIFQ